MTTAVDEISEGLLDSFLIPEENLCVPLGTDVSLELQQMINNNLNKQKGE